jgi:hypothetical protein
VKPKVLQKIEHVSAEVFLSYVKYIHLALKENAFLGKRFLHLALEEKRGSADGFFIFHMW